MSFPKLGDLPDPGIEPISLMSLSSPGKFFAIAPPRKIRILLKDILSSSFLSFPSAAWGHRFSQSNLHCDHLGASNFRDQESEGVYTTAFFEHKRAAEDVGLTMCGKETNAFENDSLNAF